MTEGALAAPRTSGGVAAPGRCRQAQAVPPGSSGVARLKRCHPVRARPASAAMPPRFRQYRHATKPSGGPAGLQAAVRLPECGPVPIAGSRPSARHAATAQRAFRCRSRTPARDHQPAAGPPQGRAAFAVRSGTARRMREPDPQPRGDARAPSRAPRAWPLSRPRWPTRAGTPGDDGCRPGGGTPGSGQSIRMRSGGR